jgi:GR25 family glycosyltransferase involved in LPS biosynthesis
MTPVRAINLDRTPERWATFQALNQGIVPFERVRAVDGLQLDRAEMVRAGLLADPALYTDGALGCALSHLALWRACLQSGAPLTLCEDDAIFHPDFPAHLDSLAKTSADQFDLVLWGWNFDSVLSADLAPGLPFVSICDQSVMRNSVEAWRGAPLDPLLLRLRRAFGSPAYTITPRGARRLIEVCFPIRELSVSLPLFEKPFPNSGVDLAMNAAYERLDAYVSFPPLVITPNDLAASTVQGS